MSIIASHSPLISLSRQLRLGSKWSRDLVYATDKPSWIDCSVLPECAWPALEKDWWHFVFCKDSLNWKDIDDDDVAVT